MKRIHRRLKKRNVIKAIIFMFSFLCLLFSIFKIIDWFIDNKKNKKVIDDIKEKVQTNEVEDNENTTLISENEDKNSLYWYYVKFPLIDVDINKLKETNSDVVGWINVNNTNVNYPFVQTSNNDYYLNHSIDKTSNEAGWIFLDYRDNKDFDNKNNIIYGHSRLDKTMFGSLSKALKTSWYNNKDNHIIRISLENENSLWQIFSVYKIETENYYITTYFENDNEYLEFLNKIKNRSLYNFDTNLNENDKILTLSTCYSETEKTVIHAKLIKRSTKE